MRQMTRDDAIESVTRHPRAYDVRLLGGFRLCCDRRVVETLPSSQRVIAFLALSDRELPRAYVAASLWPDTTDDKACANLRTALWRLHDSDHDVVDIAGSHVALRSDVWVDVRFVATAARNHRLGGVVPSPELLDLARGELLPGCWDSWLAFERERLRHEMIHLYELLGGAALQRGETHLAVLAALSAVECDPLRESSNALLISAHMACGNQTDATRAFRRYASLLRVEIGVEPSATLCSLVPVR